MSLLERWRGGTVQRDGGAPGLEAVATGIPTALLDAAEAGFAVKPAVSPSPPAEGDAKPARAVIEETVMTKVLHGWVQNRHQTLFPLAVNLRALDPAQKQTLAELIAIVLLAGHGAAAGVPAREMRVRGWLKGVGAQADTMAALDAAMADPPALSRVIDAIITHGLSPYAYIAAVVALDAREGVGMHMLEYLAARLGLPVTLVRSANRRFGQ